MKTAKDTHRLIKSRSPTHKILASDSHARPFSDAELGARETSKTILGASSCSNLSQILEMDDGDPYRPRLLPRSMCRSAFEREFSNTGWETYHSTCGSHSVSDVEYNPTHGLRRPWGPGRSHHVHKRPRRFSSLPSLLPSPPNKHDHPPTGQEKNCPRKTSPPLAGQPHPTRRPTSPSLLQPHQPTKPAIPKPRTNAQPAPSASVPQSHNAQHSRQAYGAEEAL